MHTESAQPLLHSSQGVTQFNAFGLFWNIVKSFAGAGTFALPWAVMNGGLWASVIGIILVSILANYTFRTLLACSYRVVELRKKDVNSTHATVPPSYPEIGHAAFGKLGSATISLFSGLMCFGVCIAYFNLIGGNLTAAFFPESEDINYTGFLGNPYRVLMIFVMLPICIFLSCLTKFSALAYTSVAGSIALIVAMVAVMAYGFQNHLLEPISSYPAIQIQTFPLFLGTAAFLFCDHVIILPIANTCGNIRRFPSVLNWAMVFVTVINVIFACLAYAFFGKYTCGNVIANLTGTVLADIVRIGISAEVLASFPLVANAGFNSIETGFHGLKSFTAFPELEPGEPHAFFSRNPKYYFFRASVIIFLAVLAATIKAFGDLVSLVGSLTIASTGFVFPQLFYLKLYGHEVSKVNMIWQSIIILFGVSMTFLGTYQSIDSIIQSYEHPVPCPVPH